MDLLLSNLDFFMALTAAGSFWASTVGDEFQKSTKEEDITYRDLGFSVYLAIYGLFGGYWYGDCLTYLIADTAGILGVIKGIRELP